MFKFLLSKLSIYAEMQMRKKLINSFTRMSLINSNLDH